MTGNRENVCADVILNTAVEYRNLVEYLIKLGYEFEWLSVEEQRNFGESFEELAWETLECRLRKAEGVVQTLENEEPDRGRAKTSISFLTSSDSTVTSQTVIL